MIFDSREKISTNTEFVAYLHEVFALFGVIRTRRMFGGVGIYHQNLMFGLVANDSLYLKADSLSIPAFEKLGLRSFEFNRQGKIIQMSYYQAPEEIFEDFEQATIWARQSYDAALRADKSNKKS